MHCYIEWDNLVAISTTPYETEGGDHVFECSNEGCCRYSFTPIWSDPLDNDAKDYRYPFYDWSAIEHNKSKTSNA